jgi:hypothetical protein
MAPKERSLAELRIRAGPALEDPRLVKLANECSPSACVDLAQEYEGVDLKLALATRWLAKIRLVYGQQAFDDTLPSTDAQ